jgi:predicted HTH transcriptional regulator
MSNSSLRKRFNISEKNYPKASRIIADTIDAKLIKLADPLSKSKKYAYYIPFWV